MKQELKEISLNFQFLRSCFEEASSWSYEVFLSFHGKDVRTNFADYLYQDLVGAGIRTFRDEEELSKGNEIAPKLLNAIQRSIISIPIFSKNYASSKWCLNEITEISECKRRRKQTVLPIFYKVEPTDVRNQTGRYEKAFEEHQKRFDETTVQKWRDALKEVGRLEGWHSKKDSYEGKLVKEVVKTVSSKLKKRLLSHVSEKLVGIESHIKEMLMLLDIDSGNRKTVGIHGLSGIGKTTIARVVCNTVFHHFEGYSFVENVRENAEKHGIHYLQNQLIKDILKKENQHISDVGVGIKVIKQRFCKRKVLIVLDDVDQDIQTRSLVGDHEWFGIGSKIIIISRNKDILIASKTDVIYEPNLMSSDDSLKLFSHYAFGRDRPLEDYLDLSEAMAKTIGGLPLTLQVIGSSLFKKEKSVWKSMLKKLQKIPNNDIMRILKIIYDGLEDAEQQIFLDTACFFIGMNKDFAFHIWEGCDFSPQVGLDVLCVKSLVRISEDGKLRMHDILRDLGRDIVRQESIIKPGERSRIWSQEEILDVLVKQTGTSNCKGLSIDFSRLNIDFNSQSKSQCLMSEGFAAMTELRLLQVDYAECYVIFTNSFSELRWLSWRGCPDNYALTNFCPQKLAVLDLSNSNITENWIGWNCIKLAVNLKVLSLPFCHQLSSTPDVSANQLLEGCNRLDKLPKKFSCMTSLTTLDVSVCIKLESLPNLPSSLKSFDASHCILLRSLPMLSSLKNLEKLHLRGCMDLLDISGLPSSLTSLDASHCFSIQDISGLPRSLTSLDVSHCFSIRDISGLPRSLTSLDASHCSSIRDISDLPSSLTRLDVSHCSLIRDISGLPSSLTSLNVSHCNSIRDISGLPSSLTRLDASHCSSIQDISSLPSGLTSFNVSHCNSIQYISCLPSSLTSLHADCCKSLVKLSSTSRGIRNLKTLCLKECTSLEEIEDVNKKLDSLVVLNIKGCTSLKNLPKLKNLKTLSLYDNVSLSDFEGKGMNSLEVLKIECCRSLRKMPNLPDSKRLREVQIIDCTVLSEIECIEDFESLEVLSISNAISLTTLPDISILKNLRYFRIKKCYGMKRLPNLSNLKELRQLEIEECWKLSEIPDLDKLESLGKLKISGCMFMKSLPDLSNLKELNYLTIEDDNVAEIHGVDRLEILKYLDISECKSLERLPDLSNLRSLKELKAQNCKKLTEIQAGNGLKSLELLDVRGCLSLEKLPDLTKSKNLQHLNGRFCRGQTNTAKSKTLDD
ncbi:disease resistance protein RPV1-like [Macadamia integrifolia]|uniref:disease resistance protein RPV1-like n=1 Tax=Macadamia integrifolia TaxID=60698 RepID=UPI001C4EB907|nr:disease resistance protein RPV1-like [Macadamia integrifolia]